MVFSTPPHLRAIPEGPIRDFVAIIEEIPVDEWQKRTAAFQGLVQRIPEGSAYLQEAAWYNTPAVLRHLARAIAELLKDPRSTVVKRSCASLTQLFNKCQTDARYLFKDIMPTILSVHAQTVQVIRQAVQNMVLEAIPEVPCKMVMPLWMERLKVDKSRTVRDACALYLGHALQSWGTEEGYLSEEIFLQVGATLVRSVRDPSPNVRAHAKNALEQFRASQPAYWDSLVNDPDGPAARDPKLNRWLKAITDNNRAAADSEELSVVSKFSYNSDSRIALRMATASGSSYRLPSPQRNGGAPSPSRTYGYRGNDNFEPSVPTSIAVKTSSSPSPKSDVNDPISRSRRTGLGPPLRPKPASDGTPPRPPSVTRTSLEPIIQDSTASHLNNVSGGEDDYLPDSMPSPHQTLPPLDFSAKDKKPSPLDLTTNNSTITKKQSPSSAKSLTTRALERVAELRQSKSQEAAELRQSKSQEQTDTEFKEGGGSSAGPFVFNMEKLKESASKRRNRNSMLMQERFRMSSGNLGADASTAAVAADYESTATPSPPNAPAEVTERRSEEENEVPGTPAAPKPATTTTTTSAPEHMVIAVRLLRSHKLHVDRIMETLKMEMDALRDFDGLLEEVGRPTEAEVLDYFETVGLCLDQRSHATMSLQVELDRISRGEPPEE